MSIRTNQDKLVSVSVMGQIASPGFAGLPALPYQLTSTGQPFLLPTFGGIVYNVSVGDSAYGWLADCIHPGVSIKLSDDNNNRGLNIFAWRGQCGNCHDGRCQRHTGRCHRQVRALLGTCHHSL
ncbi:DUF4438 domain-containing protein [bacterium]|nr:DUF4438 domain-containing protein [bacterium]